MQYPYPRLAFLLPRGQMLLKPGVSVLHDEFEALPVIHILMDHVFQYHELFGLFRLGIHTLGFEQRHKLIFVRVDPHDGSWRDAVYHVFRFEFHNVEERLE
jgi:hypothetical protein